MIANSMPNKIIFSPYLFALANYNILWDDFNLCLGEKDMVIYRYGYFQGLNGRIFSLEVATIIDSDFVVSKSGEVIDLCDPNTWK